MAPQKRAETRSCEIWYEIYLLIIIAYFLVELDCIFYIFLFRKHSPSWEADSRQIAQQIPCLV